MTNLDKRIKRQRTNRYLLILFVLLLVDWLAGMVLPEPCDRTAYLLFGVLFGLFLVLAALLTRWIIKDRSPWYLSPNLSRKWKTYLLAAFTPGIMIFLGSLLYS